jgi:electron transfer flavoprotein beta subunit
MKMAPDVVEELEITPDGKSLDLDAVRMILSESDDHALEEALLLKERHNATLTALALDAPEVDDALYAALAKGADRAVKIVGVDAGFPTSQAARAMSQAIARVPGLSPADLILTGVQAIDDLDGLIAPMVAHELGLPYLGIVTRLGVDASGRTVLAVKEYPGGVRGEFDVDLPAVLGIQAAEKPPRYVPVAKVRAAMKTRQIDCTPAPLLADGGCATVQVVEMKMNEPAGHAEMLNGDPENVADALCGILAGHGLL